MPKQELFRYEQNLSASHSLANVIYPWLPPALPPDQTLAVRSQRWCFQYLSGTDDGFASPVAAPNHHLLGKEDFFSWDLDSQVTTGHHNAIAGLHDLIKPDSERRAVLSHLLCKAPCHLSVPL